MIELLKAPEWFKDAACRGLDPSLFLPVNDEAEWSVAAAKKVCAVCSVRRACYETYRHEKLGVWGGTTPQERRRIQRGTTTLKDIWNIEVVEAVA